MEIILLDNKSESDWNAFCFKSSGSWFWHTTHWMNYVLAYRPEYDPVQMSFLVRENNKVVAVCPLVLENNAGQKEFSFSSFAVPSPALSDEIGNRQRKKVLDFIFGYIDDQAKAHAVKKACFRFSPLADLCVQSKWYPSNYLFKYGYLDATFNTQVLDISPGPEKLKSDVRKGHKYDINRASKMLDAHIYDAESIDRATFDLYCELHHKDAGRVTRSQITFDMMFDWIKEGYGLLVGATLKGEDRFVGFSYHIRYKSGAYYASACSDPDYAEMPIAHCILWESIRRLHENGTRFFEIGWQFYGPEFHYHTSPKEHQISKFKRGFGGEPVSQIVGEKYYDPDLFENEYARKRGNYKQYIVTGYGRDNHEK
ncbi:MAG: GNAT family N-acetyltransferase [Deltaproteobacteria bacterium]|nr:GNAT family N-acetyltransferase [Deltaproteobacteria bacterium]